MKGQQNRIGNICYLPSVLIVFVLQTCKKTSRGKKSGRKMGVIICLPNVFSHVYGSESGWKFNFPPSTFLSFLFPSTFTFHFPFLSIYIHFCLRFFSRLATTQIRLKEFTIFFHPYNKNIGFGTAVEG